MSLGSSVFETWIIIAENPIKEHEKGLPMPSRWRPTITIYSSSADMVRQQIASGYTKVLQVIKRTEEVVTKEFLG
jgi:hypothetical protein